MFYFIATAVIIVAVVYRLYSTVTENEALSLVAYISVSYLQSFDQNQHFIRNVDNEIEDGLFTHRFVVINKTFYGDSVDATYHVVQCGADNAEAIVFGHGLSENWRVWKEIMKEFCQSHRVIAFDAEGMSQSRWDNIEADLRSGNSMSFMADMQMEMLRLLGVDQFNLVVTDYSFWSMLPILTNYEGAVLRYGKMQSSVGIDDVRRLPQGQIIRNNPKRMKSFFNSNAYALARILMGKTLLRWPGLLSNARTGPNGISDEVFNSVIMTGLRKGGYTPWIHFYSNAVTMCEHMLYQISAFKNVTYPVYMLQGEDDKGQSRTYFDGTAVLEIREIQSGSYGLANTKHASKAEKEAKTTNLFTSSHRCNSELEMLTTYALDGTILGPTAVDFFPNSPWTRFESIKGAGHFVHLEAPTAVIEALKKLLAVPITRRARVTTRRYRKQHPQDILRVASEEPITTANLVKPDPPTSVVGKYLSSLTNTVATSMATIALAIGIIGTQQQRGN